jgi:hypothetical protein
LGDALSWRRPIRFPRARTGLGKTSATSRLVPVADWGKAPCRPLVAHVREDRRESSEGLYGKVEREVESRAGQLWGVALRLHAHRELAYAERESARLLPPDGQSTTC